MSWRGDLVTETISAIQALAITGVGDEVAEWPGEEAAFNEDLTFPSVWVQYAGATFGEDVENPGTTYERTGDLRVLVTHDDADDAWTILEAIEEGLSGTEITADGKAAWVDIRSERLISIHLDAVLYEQTYVAVTIESR